MLRLIYRRGMDFKSFIKKRPYLVWSTRSFSKLSNEVMVEAVLNYGDFDEVQKMIKILGMKEAARIFRKQLKQKRNNYRPEIKNYFKLYFNKYA